ncbi:MAG TPA: hypothetical protein VHE81_22850, partial [Lacipirellulaceae bacterium]|nr:hypothetical protein [Lacipirellulaceae bacterium]
MSSRPAKYSPLLLAGPAALLLLVLFFAPLFHILDLSFREALAGSLRLKPGHGLGAYIQVLTDF